MRESCRGILWAGIVTLAAGCGKSEKSEKPGTGTDPNGRQSLGASNQNPSAANGTNGGFQLPNGPLFRAKYDIGVKAIGIEVCNGKAELLVTSKFTVEIPQAHISCLANLCQFDLGSALAGMSQGQGSQNVLSSAKVDRGILRVSSIMGATFNPPRPLFLIPFALTPDELSRINISEALNVSGPAGQGSGAVGLKVNSINETYTALNGIVYSNVMRWDLTATGFETVKPKYLLFDRVSFAWNLGDPKRDNDTSVSNSIAIPEISITGKLADMMKMAGGGASGSTAGGAGSGSGCNLPFLGGGGSGGAGGGILGGGILGNIAGIITQITDFTATLKLTDQTNLDPSKP